MILFLDEPKFLLYLCSTVLVGAAFTREMDGISNIKKWNILYPIYMNSKKTIAEGRRISAAKACENPTCVEIADCCNHFKIPNAVEVHLLIFKY